MTDPIKWDEESEPVKCLLKVSRLFPNGHNGSDHATVEDLRRACEAADLDLCHCSLSGRKCEAQGCGEHMEPNGQATTERIAFLEAALAQSEEARNDLGDKLNERESQLAMARRCVAHVMGSVESEDAGDYIRDAIELAAEVEGSAVLAD